MKFFVVFAVVLAVASARPGLLHTPLAVVSPIVPIAHQYHSQDVLGQYTYGYSAPLSSKSESRSLDGVTSGAYSYIDADGKLQSVSYTADAINGFRVAGTNVPVAPEAPKQDEPKPVEDTPEVSNAKKEHLNTVEAIKARNAAIAASNPGEDTVEVGKPLLQLPLVQYTPVHAVQYYQPYTYFHQVPTFYNYQVPLVYTSGHSEKDLPADDEAVSKAKADHEAAHKEVKANLAAAGVEVN